MIFDFRFKGKWIDSSSFWLMSEAPCQWCAQARWPLKMSIDFDVCKILNLNTNSSLLNSYFRQCEEKQSIWRRAHVGFAHSSESVGCIKPHRKSNLCKSMFSFHFVNVYTPEMCCVSGLILEPVNKIRFSAIVRILACSSHSNTYIAVRRRLNQNPIDQYYLHFNCVHTGE